MDSGELSHTNDKETNMYSGLEKDRYGPLLAAQEDQVLARRLRPR